MKRFFQIAFVLDLIILAISYFATPYFVLNTQLAFIASLLIVFGSFYGYKKVVQKKMQHVTRDAIDEIEDRFELYDESEPIEDAKALFEEEKRKVKGFGKGLKNFARTSSGFFSPYRLLGYAFMVIAVLVLIKRGVFEPWSFLIGLSIVPASALVYSLLPEKS